MFDTIKLIVLRRLIRLAVAYKWRRKFATDVDVAPLRIECGDTRVAARRYAPRSVGGPLPVLLFFHGGGWVGFDLDTHDPLCRDLSSRTGHLVISVDYRLAPEHPFPAGVNDCLGALDWLKAHVVELGGDADRILVCGDSAGGNLAAVVALQARQRHPGLLKGQVRIYPVTDHGPTAQWPSYVSCGGRGYPLTHDGMKDLWRLYLKGSKLWPAGQTHHDLATPVQVTDLSELPRTLVVIAEDDLLRDEGVAYAGRMAEAGAEVQLKIYPKQKHGFVGTQPSAEHSEAIGDIATWLEQA